MVYLIGLIVLHLIIRFTAIRLVGGYMSEARTLLAAGKYTDGCSTPFKTYIHRRLKKSYELCAAHDYGGLDYLSTARPGWHNNLVSWLTHMSERNPVYWLWGTVLATVTLPWVVWRRNLGIKFLSLPLFYLLFMSTVAGLYLYVV